MKLFKWIGTAAKNVAKFVVNLGKGITGAYGSMDEVGKTVVPIAVNVVQALKTFVGSGACDLITTIVEIAIPGNADDILIEKLKIWLRKELPKIAIKLELASTAINLKTPEEKVQIIIDNLKLSKNKGANALELAAQLSLYLLDGKITALELKAAADDYYRLFVKK